MQFIVLGSVKPGTSRNARLAALATYLKRDTTGTSVQSSEEWWASHPDYFMVMEVTANTDAEVWESLTPWREMCDFKVLPVQPMRAAIEAHLNAPPVEIAAVPAPPPPPAVLAPVVPPDPIKAKLQAILQSTQYDAEWPEDSYEGDQLAAYGSIREQLHGVEPKLGTLPPGAMSSVHRPDEIPVEAWTPVFDHLSHEIEYFEVCRQWFGDDGHYNTFLRDTRPLHKDTVAQMKALVASLQLSPSGSLNMDLAVILDVIGVAVAFAQPENAWLGIVLELAGSYFATSASGGGAFNATFDQLADAVDQQFARVLTVQGQSNGILRSNWGKLSTFALMVEQSQLSWPTNPQSMLDASQRAFEIYAWQVVLPAIKSLWHWLYPTYSQTPVNGPVWNPSANAFAWAPAPVPATYQTGGCQSQTVNGYLTMTHQFGGDTYQVDNPNQDYIVPLPNDFLYRLFGQQPRPGVDHPLGIQPLDFFGNPNSPWAKIQLMPNAGSRSR